MLKFIRHKLFRPSSFEGRAALQAWCESMGYTMRITREQDGVVIDTRAGDLEGRIEWGPSQRHYLGSHELRLRGELAMDEEVHALVMPRSLMDSVERELFSQFVGGVQTRIDEDTPEEMRWLAVSPKLGGALMGDLKPHFAAVGNRMPWLAHWLQGPLGDHLMARVTTGPVEANLPFGLVLHRGRLTLRVAMPEPDVTAVQSALSLFEVALAQARQTAHVAAAEGDPDAAVAE